MSPIPPAQAPMNATTIVVGLGATGLSCARYLQAQGVAVTVVDTRSQPPALEQLQAELPDVPVHAGPLDAERILTASTLVLSPGVSPREPLFEQARAQGIEVVGDIELFARRATAPIVAITGANGKSTVTCLLTAMARACGRDVRMGGNIGTPALDLLQAEEPDLYVLELSSFQLDTVESLDAAAAAVLNISPDHMDRYDSLADYTLSKQRVYRGHGVMVLNADDTRVVQMAENGREQIRCTLGVPEAGEFGLREDIATGPCLAYGTQPLMPVAELRLQGRHNLANALAALALGHAIGLERDGMYRALKEFSGLPHRCERVAERQGVLWINDSKGTNVGATAAALAGYAGRRVILIAGGVGKGADFTPLAQAARGVVSDAILFGRDAGLLQQALAGVVRTHPVAGLDAAVTMAAGLTGSGDVVLFSPACASLDMFANYIARGEAFVVAVRGLPT